MQQRKKKDEKPFTAGEFIKYLQTFPADKVFNLTVVTHKGKELFGYPVNHFTLITDTPEPNVVAEIGRAVRIERKKGGRK